MRVLDSKPFLLIGIYAVHMKSKKSILYIEEAAKMFNLNEFNFYWKDDEAKLNSLKI